MCCFSLACFFFFKQKTAYEMRISDWSSDVCSSDLFVAAKLLVHLAEENLVDRGLGRQRGTPRSSERRGHYPRAKRNGSDSILGRVGLFRAGKRAQIGRASGRERVWQYV